MQIEEAKNKRTELENHILELLKDFEEKTGLSVYDFSVVRYSGGATRHGIIESVNAEVIL